MFAVIQGYVARPLTPDVRRLAALRRENAMRIRISTQGETDLEASVKELQELRVRIQNLLDGRAETISVDAETATIHRPTTQCSRGSLCG